MVLPASPSRHFFISALIWEVEVGNTFHMRYASNTLDAKHGIQSERKVQAGIPYLRSFEEGQKITEG